MKPYICKIDGWVAGQRVARGDVLMLSDAQAQHEPVTAVPPAPAASAIQGPISPPSPRLKRPDKARGQA